jgi:protein-S-isoprenylcysteine O-methyltransferase Ste14
MFRWVALVVFAGCLGISTFYRARARRLGTTIPRRRERPELIAGRLLVALPLFGGVLAYLVNPASMAWASIALPTWLSAAGAVLGLAAVPFALWVFRTLGKNVSETVLTKADHELVTTGPYRWIRHPLYAVGLLLFLSIGLMAANWFILALALTALIAILAIVIPREERELSKRFGGAYAAYARRTGRLLPRVRPGRDPDSHRGADEGP